MWAYHTRLSDVDFSFKIGISEACQRDHALLEMYFTYFSRNPGPTVQFLSVRIWVTKTGFTSNSVGEDRIRASDGSYGQLIDIVSFNAVLKASNLSWC